MKVGVETNQRTAKLGTETSKNDGVVYLICRQVCTLLERAEVVEKIITTARREASFKTVAEKDLPDAFGKSPKVATSIVSALLKKVLESSEYEFIAQKNRETGTKEALARGRETLGVIEWSDDEKQRAIGLSQTYLHKNGRRKGTPDCTKIASILNTEFHHNTEVRSSSGVRHFFSRRENDADTEQREIVSEVSWSEAENIAFLILQKTELHITGRHAGCPDFSRIADLLNTEFHSEALLANSQVRTASKCRQHSHLLKNRGKQSEGQEA